MTRQLFAEKFNRFACRAVCLIMCLILGFLLLISLLSTTFIDENETVYLVTDRPLVHLLIGTLVILGLYFFREKCSLKLSGRLLAVIGVIVLGLILIYVTAAGLYPRFDQRHVLQIAEAMAEGDYTEFKPGGYAEIYPYQNGLLLFYEIFARVFGENDVMAIQYFNILCMVLICLGVYRILLESEAFPGKEPLAGGISMLLFIPFWGFATFLYGNVPALALGIWGIRFALRYIEKLRIRDAVIAGVLLGAARIFKINIMIVSIAVCIAVLFDVIRRGGAKKLLLILLIVIFTLLAGKGVDKVIENRIGSPVTEGIPSLPYIAMGLHENIYRGTGWHDNYPENTYEATGNDPDATDAAAVEDIKASLQNFREHPVYMVGFFIRKVACMWNEPSFDSLSMQMNRSCVRGEDTLPGWIHTLVDKGPVNHGIYLLMNICQTLVLIGALFFFLTDFGREDLRAYIFAMFLIGGFLFHLFWEASSQYAILYMLLLVPYCGSGYLRILAWLRSAGRKKCILAFAACVLICLVLSVPLIGTFLTLNRGTQMFYEYLG